MVLNYIWLGFFLVAFVVALLQLVFCGDVNVFTRMMTSVFDSSRTAFEISIGLTGALTLWMGLMRVGEAGGVIRFVSRLLSPLFGKLFPDIPRGHESHGHIFMNISANMLGLDNAATPLGLRAMESLQTLNPQKDTASNAQIMFLVLNSSGLTLIPISIIVYRTTLGAAQPTDVFLPILIATFASTLAGIIAVGIYQHINLLNRVVICSLGGIAVLIAGIMTLFAQLTNAAVNTYSSLTANLLLMLIIVGFLIAAMRKRLNVYEHFIEGAKEGFSTAVRIIPYLVAILVAVAVFRAAGAMDYIQDGVRWLVGLFATNTDFVEALPTALMKPLSGSGARGLMVDTMTTYGADSFAGRLSCVFQGSTDTLFYILAVYFGSVGIRKTRHAVACGLIADVVGIIAAILVCYLFFA